MLLTQVGQFVKSLPLLQRSLEIAKIIPLETTHILELFAYVHSELKDYKKSQTYSKLLLEDFLKKYAMKSWLRHSFFRKDGDSILRHQKNLIFLSQRIGDYQNAVNLAKEMKEKTGKDCFQDEFPELLYVVLSHLTFLF